MKELKYIPKICSDKKYPYEGSVTLRLPSVVERYKYISECNFTAKTDGSIDVGINTMAPIVKALELAIPHIVGAEIKAKDGSVEYKDVESLIHSGDPEIDKILFEISGCILNGFKPTKN